MTREDIKKTFEGATDEQIRALLDINTSDIGKAKKDAGDLDVKLKTAQSDLKTAQDTITELEKSKGDAAELQKKIDEYKAADEKRTADEKAAAARADVEARFGKALGERSFAHDYIKAGVLSDFEKALADEANKGKGDIEIFDTLTKDKEGIFASQNPYQANMGGMGGGGQSDDDKLSDAEFYARYEKKGK
ncbi:MAG: phage scaffolding protein [Oscillospiraceae bacterium]|nr:phage scaffolding protein [Oscillospiraceae bacterium]